MAKNKDTVQIVENNGIAQSYDLAAIAGMPLPFFLQKEGKILNARNQVYYDTAIFAPGDILKGTHDKRLFIKGQRAEDTIANTGASFNKELVHTNMIGDGEFEGGTTVLAYSFEVDVQFSAEQPAEVLNGLTVDARTKTEAEMDALRYSPDLLLNVFRRQFSLTFGRSETPLHNGLVQEFPTRFCASGAMGGGARGGILQNGPYGLDSWNKLDRPQVLESEDKFWFDLKPLVSVEIPVWAVVTTMMVTKRIGEVYRS